LKTKDFPDYPDLPGRYLVVGDGDAFFEPTRVDTVLGSCVAVTFHHRRLRIGATFHALLPHWRQYETELPPDRVYRYVDSAVDSICDILVGHGCNPRDLECKIFGGAQTMCTGEMCAGRYNVQAAFEAMMARRLRVVATDVGGDRGRKLVFFSHTGEVFVRRIKGRGDTIRCAPSRNSI